MMGRTHICGGVLAGLSVAAVTQCPYSAAALTAAAGAVGGLIPDIDHKNSKISKKVPLLSWAVRLFSGHRGIFHCPLLYVVIAAVIYSFWFPQTELMQMVFYGTFAGIFSHLLLDALTVHGIPAFFPLSRKNIHLLSIKTNSFGETVVQGVLLLAVGGIIWVCR